MNLVLLADKDVGFNILNFIIKKYKKDLTLVYTIKRNKIYAFAKKNKIPVAIFNSEENFLGRMKQHKIQLGILAWWPFILSNAILHSVKNGFVNLHPSLLPYGKGKLPSFWSIVNEEPFGVTLHKANSEIDSGDIIAQKKINYNWCDNGETLYNKGKKYVVKLFYKNYHIIRSNNYNLKKNRKKNKVNYLSEIKNATEIKLNANYNGRKILNLLRAKTFTKSPGCWFKDGNCRYEVTIKINKIK